MSGERSRRIPFPQVRRGVDVVSQGSGYTGSTRLDPRMIRLAIRSARPRTARRRRTAGRAPAEPAP